MIPVQRHTWEYLEDPSKEDFKHYEGHSICQFSVCQFILTSDIILHSWINSGRISLNIFSCKDYDEHKAEEFSAGWFDSKKVRQSITIIRY
jgi:S-adenosylmethionine/arginine decarboxylase-like enzyme